MVVKEDGTKWACQSCLKGHRVSGCKHTDRELTLVPKKGRPITQCQHCRLERKKRSAHVKCDCGEGDKLPHPKEKCIHLREAEERAKSGFYDEQCREEDPIHLAAVAEEQGCCCGHGGKCSCSLIKTEIQTKDDIVPPHGPAVHKPRLESVRSDGQLTVFANGHHKPVHKRNHAAHECGMPYKLPPSRAHTEQNVATQARRSVDSLALDTHGNLSWNPAPLIHSASILDTERRTSRSEQPSPTPIVPQSCPGGPTQATLSSIDFGALGLAQTNQSVDASIRDSINMFPAFEPISATADGSYDPWSAYPSADVANMPDNNPFGVWATTYENGTAAQPALTAASSGTQSEIDEVPTMDDLYGFHMPSIQEDTAAFVDTNASDNANRRSLPPNFFGNTDFSLPAMANEWQTNVGSMDIVDTNKSKPVVQDQPLGYPAAWNTPTMPSMTSIAQRAMPATSNFGRPASHSIGPGSAPNEDIIRQLFPDIDVANGIFSSSNSPNAMVLSTSKRMHTHQPISTSPIAMDMGPMDESNSFAPQSWSDTSLPIPNDAFSLPYNLEQDFSDPQYWASTASFQ